MPAWTQTPFIAADFGATIIDYGFPRAYISFMSATNETLAIDRVVLATVNAPYKRDISAAALSKCLARAELGEWSVHLASFFTDVEPKLILAFAASHGISTVALAKAYTAMKAATGESNPNLEHELASVAATAP